MEKLRTKSRNPDLVKGIGKFSRSKRSLGYQSKKRRRFPYHPPNAAAPATVEKTANFYPAEDVKKPLINKCKPNPLISGRVWKVLIVLAGRFKGKIVVFWKQLSSGLLLITAL